MAISLEDSRVFSTNSHEINDEGWIIEFAGASCFNLGILAEPVWVRLARNRLKTSCLE